MASGLLGEVVSFVPAHLFLFELIAGSSAIGLTASTSPSRPLLLPLIAASVYGVVKTAAHHMRPRWASLLGGLAFSFLLRYIDVALITKWDFESQGPTANVASQRPQGHIDAKQSSASASVENEVSQESSSIWARVLWGWNTLWNFRQVNTPFEVRNTPAVSDSDPNSIPSRWSFVARRALIASCSYLVLDTLAQRPPPSNAATIFNPALIPFFRRLDEVTWPQIKIRAISIFMFGVTFYCVIQGAYSFAAALCVGTRLSEVRSWRPPFGTFTEAYSLRNFWGKVWHQNLRRLVSAPASYVVHNILKLERRSNVATAMTTLLSFALSGIMHMAAGHASGMPLAEMGVFEFFCTQAFGIIMETSIIQLLGQRNVKRGQVKAAQPSLVERSLGHCWVVAFLMWSGPMWLYPQAARQSPQANASSFVPYSIVQAIVQAWRAH